MKFTWRKTLALLSTVAVLAGCVGSIGMLSVSASHYNWAEWENKVLGYRADGTPVMLSDYDEAYFERAEELYDRLLAPYHANTHVNTGNYATDLIEIAKTQISWEYGDSHSAAAVPNVSSDTIYSLWYDEMYGGGEGTYIYNNWDAMFVAWCADQAGVPSSIIYPFADCESSLAYYQEKGLFHDEADYQPKPGDLIFFKSGSEKYGYTVRSMGIVTEFGHAIDDDTDEEWDYTVSVGATLGLPTATGIIQERGDYCVYEPRNRQVMGYVDIDYPEAAIIDDPDPSDAIYTDFDFLKTEYLVEGAENVTVNADGSWAVSGDFVLAPKAKLDYTQALSLVQQFSTNVPVEITVLDNANQTHFINLSESFLGTCP